MVYYTRAETHFSEWIPLSPKEPTNSPASAYLVIDNYVYTALEHVWWVKPKRRKCTGSVYARHV